MGLTLYFTKQCSSKKGKEAMLIVIRNIKNFIGI